MITKKTKLWRGLCGLFAALFAVAAFLTAICWVWEGQINLFFGITNSTVHGVGSDYEMTKDGLNKMLADSDKHDVQSMMEGAVLVKNENNALPLKKSERSVSLFGRATADPVYRGNSGGPSLDASRLVSLKSGLESEGFSVNQKLYDAYAASDVRRVKAEDENVVKNSIGEVPVGFYTPDLKKSYQTGYNDAAIVMFARDGGEGRDLATVDVDGISQLALHPQESDLLAMLKADKDAGTIKKIVVLINSPYAMELGFVDDAAFGIDAALWIGGTGLKGFAGVAGLLAGKADPSGHFVDTYAADSLSAPAVRNAGAFYFENATGEHYVVEAEGIYIGYKYYETRYQDQVLGVNNAAGAKGAYASQTNWDYADEMVYPFGYGLSYANFTQEVQRIDWDRTKHTVTAEVKVTNNGYPDGTAYEGKSKSVVQLYVQLPWQQGNAEKSAIQLLDFGKTGLLSAGESEVVKIEVSDYLFATYDKNATNGADASKKGCYVFDEGDYYFAVGENAHDALNNVLAKKNVTGTFDAKGNPVAGDPAKCADAVTLSAKDNTTYARSRFNDTVVSNQFDDIDINHFIDNAVTYLTRADWNTYPDAVTSLTLTNDMRALLDGEAYVKPSDAPAYKTQGLKDGETAQLKLVDMKDVPFGDGKWDTFLDQLTITEMASMIGETFGQIAVPSVGKPANFNSDGPAGPQAQFKLGGTPTTRINEVVACSTWNKELIAERGNFIAEDCLFDGTTQLWSPGMNLHRTPFSGRNFEYYSEDSMMSYIMGAEQVKAMQAKGLNTAPKHFAGNDQETYRSGLCVFKTEQGWRQGSLKGFEGAFTDGGALATMMSCSRNGLRRFYSDAATLTTVLRDEWDWKGVNITDSVAGQGETVKTIESLVAGTDTFNADGSRASTVKTHIVKNKDGYVLQALREANKRFFYAMSRSSLVGGLTHDSEVAATKMAWWQTTIITLDVLIGAAALGFAGLFTAGKLISKQSKGKKERADK